MVGLAAQAKKMPLRAVRGPQVAASPFQLGRARVPSVGLSICHYRPTSSTIPSKSAFLIQRLLSLSFALFLRQASLGGCQRSRHGFQRSMLAALAATSQRRWTTLPDTLAAYLAAPHPHYILFLLGRPPCRSPLALVMGVAGVAFDGSPWVTAASSAALGESLSRACGRSSPRNGLVALLHCCAAHAAESCCTFFRLCPAARFANAFACCLLLQSSHLAALWRLARSSWHGAWRKGCEPLPFKQHTPMPWLQCYDPGMLLARRILLDLPAAPACSNEERTLFRCLHAPVQAFDAPEPVQTTRRVQPLQKSSGEQQGSVVPPPRADSVDEVQ